MTALKPFILTACVAFVAGFMGYLALAELSMPATDIALAPSTDSWSSTTSAPTPAADDWNAGKAI